MDQGGNLPRSREISRFWLRRLCEVTLFVSGAIVFLYAYARFIPTGGHFPLGAAISDTSAAFSAVLTAGVFTLWLWLPHRHTTFIAAAVYLLLITTLSLLISTSGSAASPFLSLWLMSALFAGVFGAWMSLTLAAALVIYIVMTVTQQSLDLPQGIVNLALGIMPLILGSILWHRQPRHKAADKFTELENKLSSVEGKSDVVINTINDGVLAISSAGNIELINPAAQQMIGWNQGDALGLKWQSVLKLALNDGKDVPERDHPIAQALTTNKPTHNDKLLLRTSSDKRRPISIVSSPVGKSSEGVIVVFRDISKEMAEEREQAEFISTASHEMRTPVASIEGYLGLALNPATAQIDEKARDFITKAHASAQHLGRLFQDLLDISRAEDGRLKNEPRVIDVTEFVGDITQGLEHTAAEKGLVYSFRPRALATDGADQRLQPIYYVFADPDHFREVVANLIENAIKYTPEGEVVIDVTGDSSHVTVSVKDSGIGIPAEDVPHLFQKFYRVDNSDTREIGGTGLGLYLSRRLAENMDGTLRVESEYQKGSTFFLELPRISHEEAARRTSTLSSDISTAPPAAPLPTTTPSATESPLAPAGPAADTTPTPAAPATLADLEQQLNVQRGSITVPPRPTDRT